MAQVDAPSAYVEAREKASSAVESEGEADHLTPKLTGGYFWRTPTFYEEAIERLNNQLQMIRRDTAEHNHEKKLMEQREKGPAEVLKEKLRMHQRAISDSQHYESG
jgi:hypothetical protein